MKNILLFQRVMPFYRLPIFKKLHENAGVIVCHSKPKKNASLRSALLSIDFPHQLIKRIYIGNREMAAVQNVLMPLIKYKPNIITVEFSISYISFWILLILKKVFRYKIIYWTHGFTDNEKKESFFSSKGEFAKYLYSFADAIICYSDERKALIEKNIESCPPVFIAYNTIETSELLKLYYELNQKGKRIIRQGLQWKEEFHLVYIGRLTSGKRMDLLLEAFKELCKTEKSIALHIIGVGPEKERINHYANLPIYYYGEIWDDKISGELLYAADYCFNPGDVGLSIIHSFCMGTPMVTCTSTVTGPYHGPEVDYLEHGVNGIFSQSNPIMLANDIKLILNEKSIVTMSANAHSTAVNKCSPERMVNGFLEAFKYCGAEMPIPVLSIL